MRLDNQLVLETSIAAILVIFGVVTKNSFEQMGMPNHSVGKPLGMGLFIMGWIYTAYVLSVGKQNKVMFGLASFGILMAVMMMKQYMENKQTPPMVFPLIFALSWLVLGFMTGNHLSGNYKYIGLLASVLVLISMMNMLPYQRSKGIVDGPGMPLFVIAWVILIFTNSNR
jgi:hypothetical protein